MDVNSIRGITSVSAPHWVSSAQTLSHSGWEIGSPTDWLCWPGDMQNGLCVQAITITHSEGSLSKAAQWSGMKELALYLNLEASLYTVSQACTSLI